MPFVIETGSKQYTVLPGQRFVVDRINKEVDSLVDINLIYAYGSESDQNNVKAKIIAHQKGKKIRVVKYKPKSNYHRQYGFRPFETIIEILESEKSNKSTKVKTKNSETDVDLPETTIPESKEKPVKTKKPATPKVKKSES
jgi:large subunit ribosomal protein L21